MTLSSSIVVMKLETLNTKRGGGLARCHGYYRQEGGLGNSWLAMAGLLSMTGGKELYEGGAEGMLTS